jgi:NTE family protein
MRRMLSRLLPLLMLALLGACATVRPWQNQPMQPTRPAPQAPAADDHAILMVLSLSGGGARAAAFGYGVLDALQHTRVNWQGRDLALIDELYVISGVSGGSLSRI